MVDFSFVESCRETEDAVGTVALRQASVRASAIRHVLSEAVSSVYEESTCVKAQAFLLSLREQLSDYAEQVDSKSMQSKLYKAS